jgi:hypothetical protein
MKRIKNVKTEISLHILAYNLKRVMQILGTKPFLARSRPETQRESHPRSPNHNVVDRVLTQPRRGTDVAQTACDPWRMWSAAEGLLDH